MRFITNLLGGVALLAVACTANEQSTKSARKVKCESVTMASDNITRATFPAKVVAATDVRIGFRVPGVIDEIPVSSGDFVREGDVVARLDSRDYALQLAATQAEYDAIKAEVERVVALYAEQSVSANDYDKATNGLRAISAKLEAHRNALSDTELRAPFDGYIQRSNFDRGEAVAAGTPVVVMISAVAPEITLDIPAAYYLKESSFISATATIDLYKEREFNLSLKGVSPKANLNQLYRVTFTFDESDGVLPSAGMSAMVEMRYSTNDERYLSIPFSAVVEREGKSSVWLLTDDKVTSRKVEVVEITSGGGAYIKSGLKEGDVVVTAGVRSLKEGDVVAILEEPSQSNIGAIM